MTRAEASSFCREVLTFYGLSDWGVRLNTNPDAGFLGLCDYKNKIIILSAHHIDMHPEPDIKNTIRHEVAHALTPKHGHDRIWEAKAREVGCDNTYPCSNLTLDDNIIDAIRAGALIEVTYDEQIIPQQVIRTPKFTVTRLQDKCPYCGKVAKSVKEKTVVSKSDTRPDLKYITLECGHMLIKRIPKGTPFHTFQAFGDPTCIHDWDKNNCVLCGRKRPYQFQIEGMQFLEAGLAVNHGAACFDEMGLGKTIQAGGIVFFHPEYQPCLWLVKSGLKYQTSKFLLDWCGLKHCPQVIEKSSDWLIPGMKHYVIGYDMLVEKIRKNHKTGKEIRSGFDIEQFKRIGIKSIVLDECQQIKNPDSARTQQVRRLLRLLEGAKVIPLSGTPWKNRGSELYPVFNMMDPARFWSEKDFKRRWVQTYWQGRFKKEGGISDPVAFREYTKDLCIRRERSEVLPELPLVNRTKLYVKFTEDEEKVYDEAVQEFVDWFTVAAAEATSFHILAQMARMRHLIAVAKIPTTVEYVKEFIEDAERKLVVFAHHDDAQQMIFDDLETYYNDKENWIDGKPIPVMKITGSMPAIRRFEVAEAFNKAPIAVLVASQLAGGESYNLQTCSDCVMHERQWNPGNEEQAEGRFIRIGQTATQVNAVYAHAEHLTAIDFQMDNIVERKRRFFHKGMNKTELAAWNDDASFSRELAEAIVNAHNAKKNRQILTGVAK